MDLKQREPKWPYLRAINVLLSSVSVYILCTLFLFEDSILTFIYREGNTCADRLANAGFFVDGVVWWDQLPSCSRDNFSRDRVGLPNYRFR
jgi:hypothetical protein